MPFRAPLTNYHADDTLCLTDHKHTSSGKPLHPGCPGRAFTEAICACGGWGMKESGKGYVNESRKRHLASHAQGPKVLPDQLRVDGS
ncbi:MULTISPECIES: hypothetical protein [unclassified Streptomyces]|uniref:hypothetical protein n=1 Tax=unclassified Streptomyces TaxID=2593676 RepID=UPI00093925D3|nr:hypothetical protein [Streptomyces sp. TSRI0281]OKI45298.1 hypothetical protein A6A29_32190 [Streptomyces sp. TSRI0281]